MILRRLILSMLVLMFFTAPVFCQNQEEELLSTAQQAFNDGFQDVALRYLEQFNSQYPQSPKIVSAKLLLGQCYFLRNQMAKAQNIFEDLIGSGQEKDAVLFWLGETYLKQQAYTQASAQYEAVIKDFPKSAFVPQAYYSLGWSYFEQKKYDLAKGVFNDLISKFPLHQFSEDALFKVGECDYNQGNFQMAIDGFKAYLDKFPQSPHACSIHLSMAESQYYLEQFENALPMYQSVVDGSGCDESLKQPAFLGLAWSYIKLKKFSDADKVLKNAQDFSKAHKIIFDDIALARANLAYEQGNYEASLDLFAALIKDYPQSAHHVEAYLGMANIDYLLKRFEESAAQYRRVIEISKDEESLEKARFGLGWAYVKMGNFTEAVALFQLVFDQSKDPVIKANALIQMGDAHQDAGHFDEAVRIYRRVIESYAENPMADYVYYRQAIALLKSDKVEEALGMFKYLQTQFPQSKYTEDIDYYIGVASFKQGNWNQTVTTIERFLKSLIKPSEFTPEANYILALAYLNLKQPEDALKIFQKILRLYPNDVNVAMNADVGTAKCEFELGQIKEAIKRFKLIIYKYPKTDAEAQSLLWLAQYYLKNMEYPAALEFYQAFIDRFPDNDQVAQVHYELGQAYEAQNQVDQALEQYKLIKTRDASLTAKAKLAMAGIFAKDLDPGRAISAYENIVATDPDYAADAFLKLGQLYRNSQNYEKEMEIYQRALRAKDKGPLNPAQLQFNLADTLELMSRTEESIEQYLQIPHLYPDQMPWVVKAYLRVAKIYEEGKDWEGAKVTYQKILQLNTEESKYAQERLDWIKNNAGNHRR